jgi:hypothetical protein
LSRQVQRQIKWLETCFSDFAITRAAKKLSMEGAASENLFSGSAELSLQTAKIALDALKTTQPSEPPSRRGKQRGKSRRTGNLFWESWLSCGSCVRFASRRSAQDCHASKTKMIDASDAMEEAISREDAR